MSSQPELQVLLRREEITTAVRRLAMEVREDYHAKRPLLVGVLKGSFIFLADLVRYLDFPLEVDFVRLSSYGQGKQSQGQVTVMRGLGLVIKRRDVLVVEDIVDTGLTTSFLLDYLRQEEPSSLKLCALLDKPARRKTPVTIDYLGFTVPDRFLVGYGLDCGESFRNLPDVCIVED